MPTERESASSIFRKIQTSSVAAEDSKRRWNEIQLTEITKVRSLHFRESEIKKGLGGKKMSVDITAVPSKFPWRTSLFSMNRFSFGKKQHFFPSDCPSHDAVGEFTVSSELEATAELLELVGTINT